MKLKGYGGDVWTAVLVYLLVDGKQGLRERKVGPRCCQITTKLSLVGQLASRIGKILVVR